MHFRPATAADLPAIADLAAQIWNIWYPPIIGQAQVDYMLARMYGLDNLTAQMEEQGHRFFLLFDHNELLGYASASPLAHNGYFIHKFYIQTQQHRRGLGRQFLHYLQTELQAAYFQLCVNRQNIHAINFYFKNGFLIERAADFDIGNGYFMNDFVMRKQI